MKHAIEIKITADVPDNAADLGHEAIVAAREPVAALIEMLGKLGLTGAVGHRGIVRKAVKRAAPTLAAVPEAAE